MINLSTFFYSPYNHDTIWFNPLKGLQYDFDLQNNVLFYELDSSNFQASFCLEIFWIYFSVESSIKF